MKKVFLYYITLSLLLLSTTTAVDTSILPIIEHNVSVSKYKNTHPITSNGNINTDEFLLGIQSIQEINPTQNKETLTGTASRYDYDLENHPNWSKSHNTCAVRELPKYSTRKVCNLDNGKCIECYQNDYGPKEYTNRIIDMSSHGFAQIGSLRAGLMRVSIEKVK